jgi:hypothetical protein
VVTAHPCVVPDAFRLRARDLRDIAAEVQHWVTQTGPVALFLRTNGAVLWVSIDDPDAERLELTEPDSLVGIYDESAARFHIEADLAAMERVH